MIARIWHGVTPASKADEYGDYLNETGLPDYRETEGNRGVYLLRRIEGDRAHFLTLTFWDSTEAIRRFAGPDIEKARYYPEDAAFLIELEPFVEHFEVCSPCRDTATKMDNQMAPLEIRWPRLPRPRCDSEISPGRDQVRDRACELQDAVIRPQNQPPSSCDSI